MPTLVLENISSALLEGIERLATSLERTPEDTAIEMLENAFRLTAPRFTEAPLPPEPFLSEEFCSPVTIPWPQGERIEAVYVEAPLPRAHDMPEVG